MSESYTQEPAEEYGDQLKPALEDARRHQFIMVDYPVIDALAEMGRPAFIVYCVLVRFANKQKICWPTWEQLQEKSGYGFESVRKALTTLVEWGFIEREQMIKHGRYGANKYTLLDLAGWKRSSPSGKNTDTQKTDAQKTDDGKVCDYLDPVLTRSNLNLDPEDTHKTRARENSDFSPTEAKDEDGLATGEEKVIPLYLCERPIPGAGLCQLLEQHDGPCQVDIPVDLTMDTLQPVATLSAASGEEVPPVEACRVYQPGFACEHMLGAITAVAVAWWPHQNVPPNPQIFLREFRDREDFHAVAHQFTYADIDTAARWWKDNRKREADCTMPLFFSQIASTLANAQASPVPGGETARERYARKLEEQENGRT